MALSLFSASGARADVKVVSETTISGIDSGPAPVTSTVYYKGDKQRTETQDRVTIYDCAADTLYTLNTKEKTYTVSTGANSLSGAASHNPLLSMTKIETKDATITPQSGTKIIAGKPATDYAYTLVLRVTPSDPSLSDFIPSFTTTMKGEQWATDAVVTPASCARMARMNLTRALPASFANMGSGLKDLADKASQIKGLFLSSRIEFTIKPDGKNGDVGVPLPKNPIVVTSEVKSIAEDPLDDSLFTVPADYQKITPVTPPPAAAAATPPAGPAAAAPDSGTK